MRRRPLACLLVLATAVLAASPASGSELVQDPNAALLSLKVNAKGEALLTYRRADGRLRRVLAWGAINARPPSADVPQVRFRWDYAGGWGTYRNGKYWATLENRCRPYDGPALPLFVAGCKAPDGSYWAVQAWQRRLPLLGFEPWLPHHSYLELHLSHFSGELPKLEAYRTGRTVAAGRVSSAATRTWASPSTASVRTRRACRRTSTGATSTSTR